MPAESPLRDRHAAGIGLIETMRWEPDAGFLRLDRHIARLSESASVLGLECDRAAIGALLDDVGGPEPLRVRLLLGPEGDPILTTHAFVPLPAGTVWRVAVARTRLSSGDVLLRHKTTRRAVYDAARAEFGAAEADEVILLNERSEFCEGTITSVFVDPGDGGPLRTPPLESGLLAGVLRGEMLATGEAREAVLTEGDLADAGALYVGNSLRGLLRVKPVFSL